jgi:dUTP pyrophosphatase
MDIIKIKKLSGNATLPSKANDGDAGWDLYASESLVILPSSRMLVGTSVAIVIPSGSVGLIWPRSGLAVKQGIDIFAGVIDAGYRGEIKVCLFNSSNEDVKITEGDRIAQLLVQKINHVTFKESETLSETFRGEGGFGSSGK